MGAVVESVENKNKKEQSIQQVQKYFISTSVCGSFYNLLVLLVYVEFVIGKVNRGSKLYKRINI